MKVRRTLALALVLTWVPLVFADPSPDLANTVKDHATLRASLGLGAEYDGLSKLKEIRIAVLDHGFAGIGPTGGGSGDKRYLPKSTELIATYKDLKDAPALYPTETHGRHMAQLVWAATGYQEDGPKFRLYNSRGPENFVAAVRDAISWQADIILFSHNWEFFGDFAGGGFIDDMVREATQSRILWINAAGNYGGAVYNGTVSLAKGGDFVAFPRPPAAPAKYLRFRNLADENEVSVKLAWGDAPAIDQGTDQDLDLHLYLAPKPGEEDFPKLLASSKDRQVKKAPNEKDGETLFSREVITKSLSAYPDRDYLIAVSRHGGTFKDTDKLRITVTGKKQSFVEDTTKVVTKSIVFTDASKEGEIMVPADGTGITVGDVSENSANGPTRDGRDKPNLLLTRNHVTFSDNTGFYGTSYAAAYFAGIAAVLKAKDARLRAHHLLSFVGPRSEASWSALGWNPASATDPFSGQDALSRSLRAGFADQYYWKRLTDGYELGLSLPFDRFPLPGMIEAMRENPKATFYLRNYADEKREEYQRPGRYVREPDYTEVVTPARYVYFYEYGQQVYRLVPAVTRTVAGRERWVPGEWSYRYVPTTKVFYCYLTPKDIAEGITCEKKSGKSGWTKLVQLDARKKVWRTPTEAELTKVLEGR